jgi:hypothetical protein
MNLIAGEIKTLLENHDYGYPVSVVRSFNASTKVFPRIVVKQMNDMTVSRDADKELVSLLVFQIEIYTQDTVDASGKVVGRVNVSDDIADQIDTLIYGQYKMNRDSVNDDDSYAIDTARRIMRYSCAIDQYDYTYRIV